jgi:hypothetical protein
MSSIKISQLNIALPLVGTELVPVVQNGETLKTTTDDIAYLAKPAYVNYFDFSSNSVTTVDTADTWYKLNSNTTTLFSRNGLAHTNNRVTNVGPTRIFKLEGIVSMVAGNNQEIHAAFFRDGVLYPCSEQSTITGTGNRTNAIPFQCVIELTTNQYVEVWVKNQTGTNNITLKNLNVIITET